MAIPDGFKFSGVPRDVKTKDGGSALVKSKRGTYSFPDDFAPAMAVASYTGSLINFGATGGTPFDSYAIWDNQLPPTGTQTSMLILPFDCTLKSVSFKWIDSDSAAFAAATTTSFKIYTIAIDQDPNSLGNWTERLTLSTTLTDADDGFPGFLEVITDTTVYTAGTGITLAADPSGNVVPDDTDPSIILTIQGV